MFTVLLCVNTSITHNYVTSTDKLQAWLKDGDIQDVNKVTEVVGQQPVVNIIWGLVGEGPANWDEPHIPVPGETHQEHPQDIH